MDSYQEKINLLQEMIAFALIDGELHDREYDFLEMVAMELEIEKTVFHKLFGFWLILSSSISLSNTSIASS